MIFVFVIKKYGQEALDTFIHSPIFFTIVDHGIFLEDKAVDTVSERIITIHDRVSLLMDEISALKLSSVERSSPVRHFIHPSASFRASLFSSSSSSSSGVQSVSINATAAGADMIDGAADAVVVERVAGDAEDAAGDAEDAAGDTEDAAGDVEDAAGDTEDAAGDAKDVAGDAEDAAGAVGSGVGVASNGDSAAGNVVGAFADAGTADGGDISNSPCSSSSAAAS